MDPRWGRRSPYIFAGLIFAAVRAALKRTRLSDPAYIGEIMNTVHLMSTSLRLGLAPPSFFSPLLEGFYASLTEYGFDVTLEDDLDLPRHAYVYFALISCRVLNCLQ